MRLKQRRYKRVPLKVISELNMTPVIDVTFLMLIAFLVTYPLMENTARIRLPTASTEKPEPQDKNKTRELAINAAGDIFLDGNIITLEALTADLAQRVRDEPDTVVRIRGDEFSNYGQLMKVVAVLKKTKVKSIGLASYAEGTK